MRHKSKPANDLGPIHAFGGACLLTVALLLPHAPLVFIIAGMLLAGLIQWMWRSYRR